MNSSMSESQFAVIPSCWPEGPHFLDPLTRSFCNAAGQWGSSLESVAKSLHTCPEPLA